MSLLDRVQRKAEGTPPSSAPSAPSPSAPPGAPDRPSDDGAERFPPAGWQNRPGGVSPAPVPATPAPAARPFEVERPAPAPEPQRAPTLLNRAGGMRPGMWPGTGVELLVRPEDATRAEEILAGA